tara:strand:- start:4753 stop:4983 length:231 start_codon:yes stop_codon:yes gene_type:complete
MQTSFTWDESVEDEPFDLTERQLDCGRIQVGDHFEVWVPYDGGSTIYRVIVTDVHFFMDQTFGDPDEVTQWVSFIC